MIVNTGVNPWRRCTVRRHAGQKHRIAGASLLFMIVRYFRYEQDISGGTRSFLPRLRRC
jgi:hypothetical protein